MKSPFDRPQGKYMAQFFNNWLDPQYHPLNLIITSVIFNVCYLANSGCPFINGWPGCQWCLRTCTLDLGVIDSVVDMFLWDYYHHVYDASLPKPIRYLANKFLINYFKLWQNITKLCLEFHPLMSLSIIISQGTDIILHSIPPTTTTTTKHPS